MRFPPEFHVGEWVRSDRFGSKDQIGRILRVRSETHYQVRLLVPHTWPHGQVGFVDLPHHFTSLAREEPTMEELATWMTLELSE
jgi:hypothetical protein